jgi:hypothetical protein
MAVCSEIHTKQINKLVWENVELLNVKLVVHIVTTVFIFKEVISINSLCKKHVLCSVLVRHTVHFCSSPPQYLLSFPFGILYKPAVA